MGSLTNKPVWVELSSTDPAAARSFYSKVFGWKIDVQEDPQYGGYGMARVGGKDAAGIGGKQPGDPSPSNWNLYIGADDAAATAAKVKAAGGTVVAEPFDVGDQGRIAVFRDPSGAFISAWESKAMRGFESGPSNTFGWMELSARGLEKALPFYRDVFRWAARRSSDASAEQPYTEFRLEDRSIAGAMEMNPMVPAEVPSYWMPYFNVDDVDGSFKKVVGGGGREMVAPQDFPGGRFAIVADPQGAAFGVLKAAPRG